MEILEAEWQAQACYYSPNEGLAPLMELVI